MIDVTDADVYRLTGGDAPLLISVPHDGRNVPSNIAEKMSAAGGAIPDTDWHVAELYRFCTELDASMLVANYSRYVVDLNRSASNDVLYPGQVVTGLCPEKTFAGDPIYDGYSIDDREIARRIACYWQPYHDCLRMTLARMVKKHGYALLWDAHSIPGAVPRLFDGVLPLLNLGSNDNRSTTTTIADAVFAVADESDYDSVLNGRFKGGYITRHYGDPAAGVHALQLEIAQRAYMDESSLQLLPAKMERLRDTLRNMMQRFQEVAQR